MTTTGILFGFFLIFCGASILATIALFTRQSLLVAYMILGILIGPWGVKLISQTHFIHELSGIGIVFLLFLLGLELQLTKLFSMLRGAVFVAFVSCAIFGVVGSGVAAVFGFSWIDSILVGITMMFSSTIISIKLLPSPKLYHQSVGKMMVSVLLLQDFIAILVLFWLDLWGAGKIDNNWIHLTRILLSIPLLVLFAVFFEKWVLFRLLNRFAAVKEYLFLLALGWCLGMAQLAHYLGISYEIGAFIAGVTLTTSPVSVFIAERLKPLRDFFLIVFFFSVGASVNFWLVGEVIIPVLVVSALVLIVKPLVYRALLPSIDGNKANAWELGFRLGQASEFSLLVGFLAFHMMVMSEKAYLLVQAVTVVTFLVSSYFVSVKYPSQVVAQTDLVDE
jgi:Kef-type K+ transport system membrane component KefB